MTSQNHSTSTNTSSDNNNRSISPYIHNSLQLIPPIENNHPMKTRAKIGIYKPEVYLVVIEPNIIKQALTQPQWMNTMNQEYASLIKNNTCTLSLEKPIISFYVPHLATIVACNLFSSSWHTS